MGTRPMLQDEELFIALSPEAELWLMANTPADAEIATISDPEVVREWVRS